MKNIFFTLVVITLSFMFGRLLAEQLPLKVGQKDKTFTVEHLSVKVGDEVTFMNDDPFFHNVFSLSPAATFDLGSYPQGESKAYRFEEAGTVQVECAIHPSMQMIIEVQE